MQSDAHGKTESKTDTVTSRTAARPVSCDLAQSSVTLYRSPISDCTRKKKRSFCLCVHAHVTSSPRSAG